MQDAKDFCSYIVRKYTPFMLCQLELELLSCESKKTQPLITTRCLCHKKYHVF